MTSHRNENRCYFQDYSVSMYLRQKWLDGRLAFGNLTHSNSSIIVLDSKHHATLWTPDLFFSNEKQGDFHHVTVPNTFIRIYANGTVAYSTR